MPGSAPREGSFGWRGWLGVLSGLATVAAFIAAVFSLAYLAGFRGEKPHHSAPGPPHLSNRDYAYWYCWNRGDPRPHHLGAFVQGDHICSEEELQATTSTP